MKKTILRILALTLALLCVIPFTACGDKEEEKPANDAAAIRKTLVQYVNDNQKVLNAVADKLAATDGLSYYYVYGNEDGSPRVEQGVLEDGSFVRKSSDDRTLLSLAKAGFTGEITHSADTRKGTVSFFTYYHDKQNSGFYIVRCPDENAMDYLSNHFLTGEVDVTVQPITGDWYYVEAR